MTSQPIKIVYLIGQLGLGGSERQLYLLLKHMDKRRFSPHVVVFNPSPNYTLDDDLRREGVFVHAIPQTASGIPRRALWLLRLLRSIHPEIIHSWSVHDNAYAAVIGKLIQTPLLIGSERISLRDPDFRALGKIYHWLILFGVHKHIVNAASIASELRQLHVHPDNIFILPNCVECPEGDGKFSAAENVDLPSGKPIVGMVANLRRQKNYPLFIQAMIPILREFSNAMGVMVGQVVPSDPEVPDQILNAIEQSGFPGRLLWLGFQKDIPALLRRFSIFCLTSNWEGTPNAVLEAMAAELPVVVTRVDGAVNLVQDGVMGILVEPGQTDQVSEGIRRLLADPALAKSMGRAGQRFVRENFDCSSIVMQLQDYYLDLLDG